MNPRINLLDNIDDNLAELACCFDSMKLYLAELDNVSLRYTNGQIRILNHFEFFLSVGQQALKTIERKKQVLLHPNETCEQWAERMSKAVDQLKGGAR